VFTDSEGIARGTITLLTVPLSPELPMTENRMRTVCLHEIGHALGLGGHTTNPDDIMFYTSSLADVAKHLSDRDRATLVRLYSGR
jgi:predicted Zn-dependent protease